MSRQDRLESDLDRGFTALEEGRIDEAAAAVERCQRIDRGNADVVLLSAAVADARGDAANAIALYSRLVELRPDDPMPRICAARIQLRDLGDPDAALQTLADAFDFIDEETDLIEAVIVRVEALIANVQLEDARDALSELASSVIDDAELALDLAELALAAEDPAAAARWIEIARKDPTLAADALHLLGRVHESTEDRARMIAAWQEVRALDTAAQRDPAVSLESPGSAGARGIAERCGVSIAEDELERIASAALAELPAEVRAHLERVPILIDDLPSEALVADGLDPRSLGVFQGTPMPEGGDLAASVTSIHLFRKNLERVATDLDELAEEVRITVLHETAHYFGLDEEDLERIGLD